jgi:hypothetical protein
LPHRDADPAAGRRHLDFDRGAVQHGKRLRRDDVAGLAGCFNARAIRTSCRWPPEIFAGEFANAEALEFVESGPPVLANDLSLAVRPISTMSSTE